MDKVRVATIGSSAIAERFLGALAQGGRASYVAAYSRSAEKARAFGAPHGATIFFDDLDVLSESPDVDMVYVASPNAVHVEQVTRLLKAGKHVLCEKTIAPNEAQAHGLFELAHERDALLMEAMRSIHDPRFGTVRSTIPELGEVRLATLRFSKISSRVAKLDAGELPGVFDPRLAGGALTDIGVYCVEPMVALFGRPDDVKAAGIVRDVSDMVSGDACDRIDLASEVLCSYPGKVVNLSYGKVSDNHVPSQIQGEKGTLLWPKVSEPAHLSIVVPKDTGRAYGSGEGVERALPTFDCDNNMVYEVADFIAAVLGDDQAKQIVSQAEEVTLGSLAVMDEIRRQLGVRFPADA